jgi:predicted CXXCH cytochrome family protein
MKGVKLLWIGFVFFLATGLMVSSHLNGVYAGSIVGTKHDLSIRSWGAGSGSNQICIFCHTPHNARTDLPEVPLWNHGTTTTNFNLYTSPTLDATVGQPNGASKACLSCHDGTVGLDVFGEKASSPHTIGAGRFNLGTDLSNDHPISFTYDAALAAKDKGLYAPVGADKVVEGIPLYYGKMECSSCHSVHDNTNQPFLRHTNVGSALCLKCHIK